MSITDRIYADAAETFYTDPVVMVMGHTWRELEREVKAAVVIYSNAVADAKEVVRIGGYECYPLDTMGHGYIIGERIDMIQIREDLKRALYRRIL